MEEPLLIEKTLKKIEFLFKYSGVNVKTGKETRNNSRKRHFMYILNFIWLNTDLAGSVVWFFTGIANSKSFIELTYVTPCITMSFLGNLKCLYFILYEKNVDSLITVLKDLEIKENSRDKDVEKDKIIKSEHNFITNIISFLNIFYFVFFTTFALIPVSLVALKYFTTNKLELLLPFLIVYPFDAFDIKYWPWVYLHQVWSEIVVVIDILASDYIFYTFCTYVRLQFRLLKYEIERIIPSEPEDSQLNYEEIRAKMSALIKWHQDLISSTKMLETFYTRPTLLNFMASSVLICFTGFNVVAISDVAFVFTFLCFLFTSLLQIFFLCFFGDLLMSASMEISDAVYNCRWYLADRSLRKDLLLIQTRAQTPCKLTASEFALVNFKAFMKILSTAWSYFALLQTLYGGAPI